MSRIASTLLLCAFGLSFLSGCSTFRGWFGAKKADPYAESYDQTMTAPANNAYPVYEPLPTQPAYASPGYTGGEGGARVHTVGKKETLYSIARTYYNGDHTKWREIYEANRADIADPNRIRVGQRLVIP